MLDKPYLLTQRLLCIIRFDSEVVLCSDCCNYLQSKYVISELCFDLSIKRFLSFCASISSKNHSRQPHFPVVIKFRQRRSAIFTELKWVGSPPGIYVATATSHNLMILRKSDLMKSGTKSMKLDRIIVNQFWVVPKTARCFNWREFL